VTTHRECAEQALSDAQSNPVLSAEQSFTAAQVHVLLAIDQSLRDLVAVLRPQAPVRLTS
jgi:hypothetical protein